MDEDEVPMLKQRIADQDETIRRNKQTIAELQEFISHLEEQLSTYL